MSFRNNENNATERSDLGRRKFLLALATLGAASTAAIDSFANQDDGGISTDTLKAVEKIAGIELSDKEREEILEGVAKNRAVYDALRKQRMDYFQFPSLMFNPVPPGMRFDAKIKKRVFSKTPIQRPRAFLAAIVIAWSLFTGLTALMVAVPMLVAVRLLFGLAEAGIYPTASRAIYSWSPPRDRGRAQGLLFIGSRLGAACRSSGPPAPGGTSCAARCWSARRSASA